MITISAERPDDIDAVHRLNASAFDTRAEADLVDALRARARPVVSLVAKEADMVVGHIMFSPVSLSGARAPRIMGLAPMAVAAAYRGRGVGSALVVEGLARCRQLGFGAVVVLGHPGYYPRFGFVNASRFGISSEYDVPDEAFMTVELEPGCLHGASGIARYHDAFGSL